MTSRSMISGIILVAAGIIFLADNFNLINLSWSTIWPWFIIIGGAMFLMAWLGNRREYALLMPATIMLTYGLLFLYNVYYDWYPMAEQNLWALFIVGPGLGMLLMYFFGEKEKSLLIPGVILCSIGAVFLAGGGGFRLILAIVLIGSGAALLLGQRKKAEELPAGSDIDSIGDSQE